VCADIDDFHEMATDEDMAIRFYEKGNSDDLAEQFIVILKSPELQRKMAEHNFAAGVEMTITTVVKNYLRWFELHKCKREMLAPCSACHRGYAGLEFADCFAGPAKRWHG
jgi:hypothetical protein